MFTYKLSPNFLGQPNSTIIRSDDTFIPPDPGNTDYQAYLKWLEEGGVPTPADE
jgi:hypothetical protein